MKLHPPHLLPTILPLLLLLLHLPLATTQETQTTIITATLTPTIVTETVSTIAASASASTSLSSTYTDPTDFTNTMLNYTNYYRYLHSSPFLRSNSTLSDFAQSYSSECIWSHNPALADHNYGENLARGYPDLTSAITAWYDEVSEFDYDFDKDDPTGFTEETGHFTQLVWRDSKAVGCGWTDCGGRNGVEGVLVVCDYWPAGNVMSAGGNGKELFVKNVLAERKGGDEGFDERAATEGVRTDVGEEEAESVASAMRRAGGWTTVLLAMVVACWVST